MKNIKPIVTIVCIVVAMLLIYVFSSKNQQTFPQTSIPSNLRQNIFESKSDNQGGVTAMITPKDLSAGVSSWDFEISFNTHSDELNYDLTQVVILVDESGKEYKPTAWDGDPPGGHHRGGVLEFNPIIPLPQSITVKIGNVGGIAERSFSWKIQ